MKRIKKEFLEIKKNPIPGVKVISPLAISDSDFLNWKVELNCIKDTTYEDETISISITFTEEYPFSVPVIHTLHPVNRPNIQNGRILLHSMQKDHSLNLTISQLLHGMLDLLSNPTDLPLEVIARNRIKRASQECLTYMADMQIIQPYSTAPDMSSSTLDGGAPKTSQKPTLVTRLNDM